MLERVNAWLEANQLPPLNCCYTAPFNAIGCNTGSDAYDKLCREHQTSVQLEIDLDKLTTPIGEVITIARQDLIIDDNGKLNPRLPSGCSMVFISVTKQASNDDDAIWFTVLNFGIVPRGFAADGLLLAAMEWELRSDRQPEVDG